MAQKTKKKVPVKVYKGIALRTQRAFLGGRWYDFKIGQTYEIKSEEVFGKLTNKEQPVLRGV